MVVLLLLQLCNGQVLRNCTSYAVDDCKFYCDKEGDCSNGELECGNKVCLIICSGTNSCCNLTINFENATGFYFECLGKGSCDNLFLHGPWIIAFDPTPYPDTPTADDSSSLSSGGVVAIVFSVVIFVLVIVFLVDYCRRRRRLRNNETYNLQL